MKFEKFKERVIEGLKQIYEDNVEISADVFIGNNGSTYNGIYIFMNEPECKSSPVVNLDKVYDAFEDGRMGIGDCVWEIYYQREALRSPEEVRCLAERAMEWEAIKSKIYPVLISTEENKEMLKELVSKPMLDLSVIYAIRSGLPGDRTAKININWRLLKHYGISSDRLHKQAMKNLEKDGYRFRDMFTMLKDMKYLEATKEESYEKSDPVPAMFVLTNTSGRYGAAGILNKKLIKEFAGGRDFIILPSSVHETIFVPVIDKIDQRFCDGMVSEVNRTVVDAEERLSNHSYYYSAEDDEIRICA